MILVLLLNGSKEKYEKRQKEINEKAENWEIERENIKKCNNIRDEYNQLTKSKTDKLSMSKKALIFLFINCTLVEIFTGWVTVKSFALAFAMGIMPDFSPLLAIIGAVVGEVVGLMTYYAKSTKENTVGGIVYENSLMAYKETNNNE